MDSCDCRISVSLLSHLHHVSAIISKLTFYGLILATPPTTPPHDEATCKRPAMNSSHNSRKLLLQLTPLHTLLQVHHPLHSYQQCSCSVQVTLRLTPSIPSSAVRSECWRASSAILPTSVTFVHQPITNDRTRVRMNSNTSPLLFNRHSSTQDDH